VAGRVIYFLKPIKVEKDHCTGRVPADRGVDDFAEIQPVSDPGELVEMGEFIEAVLGGFSLRNVLRDADQSIDAVFLIP
jgi:hypothetical protein